MRVEGGSKASEAVEQAWGRGVEKLVGNAEDTALANGAKTVPVALGDDAGERDASSGSAPGEDKDIGVGRSNFFGGGVGSGSAEKAAVGGSDELGDPGLRADEGFAPLFAVDEGTSGRGGGVGADSMEGSFHAGDEGSGFGGGMADGGDEADVGKDVGQCARGEGENRIAGPEDGGEGFAAVGDRGDEEVGLGEGEGGLGGAEVVGVTPERPGVLEDGQVAGGELRESFDAIAGAGAEEVEAAEGRKGEGDRGLERGEAH